MSDIADSVSVQAVTDEPIGALESRLIRVMAAVVALAVIGSAVLAPWRVTAGLALGGTLALLNYHWLRTSVRALLSEATVKRPRITITRYVLRHLIIGAVVFAGYLLQWVSLPATIVGLCAFVPALFVEAFRQFYFAIIHREGSY
ncbi:MAG: hypothetical protein DMF71_11160 [Acidobacteria bacterium]|nr:MAG: hypothetical protein DMF71_11160 [Acidobacteriota bacterium]